MCSGVFCANPRLCTDIHRVRSGVSTMNLGVLIEGLKARAASGARPESVRICDITDDSRTVVPGSLFIARAGT